MCCLQIAYHFGLQILPNGDACIPSLVNKIIGVATNGNKGIVVDKKLIDGSEANDRGKVFIPLFIVAQVKGFLGSTIQILHL